MCAPPCGRASHVLAAVLGQRCGDRVAGRRLGDGSFQLWRSAGGWVWVGVVGGSCKSGAARQEGRRALRLVITGEKVWFACIIFRIPHLCCSGWLWACDDGRAVRG